MLVDATLSDRGGARLPAGLVSASECSSKCVAAVAACSVYEWIALAVGRGWLSTRLLDHHLLTAHMVQHLLLMTVAAPLVLLGAPAITLLYGFPPGFASHSARLPASVGRIFTHPVFCWLAGTTTVIGWHVPALFAIGMRSERWHAGEHASFFVAGLLFWWPVIRPWPSLATWPRWCIPLYLFLATLPCDALSAFLTFCNRVVYPHYLSAHQLFDISPLGDQECAGALMWVWVTFAYLAPAAVVTIQMLSPQQRALNAEVV